MLDPQPPKRNEHGREIWFKAAVGENGYAPIHRKGCAAFIMAVVWILFSAGVGVFLVTRWVFPDVDLLTALMVPFLVATPGMLLMGVTVRRHS